MTLTRELLDSLPKAELHVHLDGCLRPTTMLELAQEQGVTLPAETPEALADAMYANQVRDLEEYLQLYRFPVSVMQTRKAMERIAYEFVVDCAADNVRYVEARYCPALHTPALSLTEAIEAPLAGLKRGEAETGTIARLIVSGLRTFPPSVTDDLARAAVDYGNDGVVAFDLAGSERGYPAANHVSAFEYANGNGLACTCHAGEAAGPESIHEAVHICGAQRIGHGTRLFQDPDLEEQVLKQGIPLEVCLSSNLHTRAVSDLAEHPARRYLDLGGTVTLNTDSRLMDRTTVSAEYWLAHRELGLDRAELDRVILNSCESAFLPEAEKARLIAMVTRELQEIQ
ncbi:MAG: adenosine deaminase [Gemmatimonadales bacterium]|nr:adenosine deaminase [Gemmatimonadales bacterium]NIN10787.1 adenosine deaminase [Gemmatimonadales bacterium]NIN48933.1 adenosine deaminase [Gemmatimonadales bacterium]NIP06397.1 adenosine deaminase [Gemmatimonadales bacterium]NIR00208.1 adenosine deaminase [Gemmatimonadales bacterium]